jgi:hypothetical protein
MARKADCGRWIMIRVSLPVSGKMHKLARLCNIEKNHALGAFVAVYSAANQLANRDGFVAHWDAAQVDEIARVAGFGIALAEIGWFKYRPDGVVVHEFDKWNGLDWANRAEEAARKKQSRAETLGRSAAVVAEMAQPRHGDLRTLPDNVPSRQRTMSATPADNVRHTSGQCPTHNTTQELLLLGPSATSHAASPPPQAASAGGVPTDPAEAARFLALDAVGLTPSIVMDLVKAPELGPAMIHEIAERAYRTRGTPGGVVNKLRDRVRAIRKKRQTPPPAPRPQPEPERPSADPGPSGEALWAGGSDADRARWLSDYRRVFRDARPDQDVTSSRRFLLWVGEQGKTNA